MSVFAQENPPLKVNLTCAATNADGGTVVGDESGELRLFNDINKRAKVCRVLY